VPRYQTESIIKAAILEHKPRTVISGAANGVDMHGVEIAHLSGIGTVEYVPEKYEWDVEPGLKEATEQTTDTGIRVVVPGGFKARNQKIAESCDCLLRIASTTTKTYGSGWTADLAERLGKRVFRHTV
jgi:hypothetical protein